MEPLHTVFPVARAGTLAGRYAAQSDRTEALAIDEPLLFHLRRRVELPPGTRVVKLAPELTLRATQLTAERRVKHEGAVLVEDFRLNLPVGAVGAEAFGGFVRDLRKVDDGFLHGTRIELGK
jgi:hypothetical protein